MQAELPAAAEVQAAVERVSARRELAPPEPGLFDPVTRALDRVWSWIGGLFGRFGELQDTAPPLYYGVLAVLVVLGVAILAFFLHNLFSRLREGDAPARVRLPAADAPARPRSAGEWEEEARRAAGAGRYREAAVALYQALLLRLEAAGAVRYDPAKTPGEYRREARPHERAARALAGFLRGFEPVAFGGRTLDAEGYARLCAAAAEGGAHGQA